MNGSVVALRQPSDVLWPGAFGSAALYDVVGEIEPHSEPSGSILAQRMC